MNNNQLAALKHLEKEDIKPKVVAFGHWIKNKNGKCNILYPSCRINEQMEEEDFIEKILLL